MNDFFPFPGEKECLIPPYPENPRLSITSLAPWVRAGGKLSHIEHGLRFFNFGVSFPENIHLNYESPNYFLLHRINSMGNATGQIWTMGGKLYLMSKEVTSLIPDYGEFEERYLDFFVLNIHFSGFHLEDFSAHDIALIISKHHG